MIGQVHGIKTCVSRPGSMVSNAVGLDRYIEMKQDVICITQNTKGHLT